MSAYNEEPVIEQFIRTVMETLKGVFSFELLIVDDGSRDNTAGILERLKLEYNSLVVVTHPVNRGLGAGLKTGFENARGNIIVTLDADLSQTPGLIPRMVEEIEKGADVVIGSRYVKGGGMVGVPWWRGAISRLGNYFLRTVAGIRVRDCTSGMRAYRSSVVRQLDNIGTGFEVQFCILKEIRNAKFTEVPLALVSRVAGQSKMRYLWLAPKYLFVFAAILREGGETTFKMGDM